MKPVVILDTNALYGQNPFTRTDCKEILALAKTEHIRLVIPEVVVHELSRQWMKRLGEKRTKLLNAVDGFNGILAEVGTVGLIVEPQVLDRSVFYDTAEELLQGMKVETPTYPDVSIADLLARDLDYRKPFAENGKGFRDALIWETIQDLCSDLDDASTPVIFVTDNHTDFCVDEGGALHPHLRSEISSKQRIEVVKNLVTVLAHEEIEPLAKMLRVVDEALTPAKVVQLITNAFEQLYGLDLEQTVGVYEGEGITTNPIGTALEGSTFDEILPDDDTVEFEVFNTGDPGEMAIRVTVEADCTIDGYVHKSDLAMYDLVGLAVLGEWNSHMMHANETRRVRFTLGSDFTKQTIEDLELSVEQTEDITEEQLSLRR